MSQNGDSTLSVSNNAFAPVRALETAINARWKPHPALAEIIGQRPWSNCIGIMSLLNGFPRDLLIKCDPKAVETVTAIRKQHLKSMSLDLTDDQVNWLLAVPWSSDWWWRA